MTPSSVYTAELVEAIKVAVSTNILRVTIKPLVRLPPSPRDGEKKQKKLSTQAEKKDNHNSSSTPQPLSARVRVTEGKMERVESVGLSKKPPITTSMDRKEPPQWFVEHMDKVRWLHLSQLLSGYCTLKALPLCIPLCVWHSPGLH